MTSLYRCNVELHRMYSGSPESGSVILEAGGGSVSHFVQPDKSTVVTLDIDRDQLKKNVDATVKVQGDIHSIPLQNDSICQVVCFNVIEHLTVPEFALNEMCRVLKSKGILVLGFPDRNSLKGLITRTTPTWFHRAYYRFIVRKPDSGSGHFDVFPTIFGEIVSGKQVCEWLASRNMSIEFYSAFDGANEYQITSGSLLRRIAAIPYYALVLFFQLLSFGKWRPGDSDVLLIARKYVDGKDREFSVVAQVKSGLDNAT